MHNFQNFLDTVEITKITIFCIIIFAGQLKTQSVF